MNPGFQGCWGSGLKGFGYHDGGISVLYGFLAMAIPGIHKTCCSSAQFESLPREGLWDFMPESPYFVR